MNLAAAQAQKVVDFILGRKFEEVILSVFPLKALAIRWGFFLSSL